MPLSPCVNAPFCAVTMQLPDFSHLLFCAVPAGMGPPEPDGDCKEERLPQGPAHLCSSVPFPLLVLSPIVHQLWSWGLFAGRAQFPWGSGQALSRGNCYPTKEVVNPTAEAW